MKKVLCILANEYPFGTWEPYLETEINYYGAFDKVFVFSLQLRKEHAKTKRAVPEGVLVYPIFKKSNLVYFLYLFCAIFDRNFYSELLSIFKQHTQILGRIKYLMTSISRSYYEYGQIRSIISKSVGNGVQLVLYSYRFEYQPYVAILLKSRCFQNAKIVSRAHGLDLYSERHSCNYIPLRNPIFKGIDRVFPCSAYGERYLKSRFPLFEDKVETSYLGTHDRLTMPINTLRKEPFKIVSCSRVDRVKRVHLIAEALSLIKGKKIEWTHIGGGEKDYTLQSIVQNLPSNVRTVFAGSLSNHEVLELYGKVGFSLFLNVSSTEGLPVSIMEAISFGIPCVATNVGGTSEIIKDGVDGRLLNANFQPKELADMIESFIDMSENDYFGFCERSRAFWQEHFDAAQNYGLFSSCMLRM